MSLDFTGLLKYFAKGLLFFVIAFVINLLLLVPVALSFAAFDIFGILFAIPMIVLLLLLLVVYGWIITKVNEVVH